MSHPAPNSDTRGGQLGHSATKMVRAG